MNLTEIGNKYECDKANCGDAHGFTDVYHDYFRLKRNDIKSILEIGVWCGRSLHMWCDYFLNANIYGIENNPDFYNSVNIYKKEWKGGDRVKLFLADQSDREALRRIGNECGPFDIIIDDGCHAYNYQQISWGCLFPFVKPSGVYIIEDLQNAEETRDLLREFKLSSYTVFSSPDIFPEEADYIKSHTKSAEMFHTRSDDIPNAHTTSLIEKRY